MKTKTKKLMFGLGLALSGYFAQAQGIDGIIVEKYYVANAADAANSAANSANPLLIAGQSVTYRVYVDMAAGWKFSLLKGNANHPLKIATTTAFYNDPNNGVEIGAQGISGANIKKNTVHMDSYLTTGGVSAGKVAVIEAEDTDGSLGNTQNILQNNPGGLYGLPINSGTGIVASTIARDGLINGTAPVPTAVGFGGAGTPSDVFIDNAAVGTFSTTNGAMSALGGAFGFGPNNTMLLGQFTTDGVFTFELNIQLINPSGTAVEYVASAPIAGETVFPGLTLLPPAPPIVAIGGPANLITGNVGTYTATATDLGTVTSVQFQVDGVNSGAAITGSVGATYSLNYTGVTGTHTISLIATDNDLLTGTASQVVTVAANQAPTSIVTVSSPNFVVGDVVSFTVTASDVDGTVVSKFAEIDGVSVGVTAGPVSTYTALATLGVHSIRAKATDNLGLTNPAYSAVVNYTVAANVPPTAVIVTPSTGTSYLAPAVASVSATATDVDGTVSSVVFLVNGVPTQTATVAPYTFAYTTSTLATGPIVLTVRSTDDRGAVTLSTPVVINVSDPNALPYTVVTTTATCLPPTFCLPIAAASTYTVNDVIGYDFTLNYDITKVSPTGTITIYNNLITSSFVEVASFNDAINGKLNISLFLNATAPANAEFNGTGDLICVEFAKTAGFASGVDNALFSITNLEESYFTGVQPKLASNGEFKTSKDTTFNASLRFWSNQEPIRYDVASPSTYLKTDIYGATAGCVTNTLVAAVQTNTLGNFTHNLVNGQSISIERDIINTTNVITVVNSQDAFIGKRVTLSIPTQTINIFQALALDVNLDGKISAGDVSQIQQRLALIIGEFKQAWNHNAAGVSDGRPSKDWVFVDSLRLQNDPAYAVSSTFPLDNGVGFSKIRVPVTPFCLPATVTNYSVCPLVTPETYKGVMVGDADGSYALVLADGSIKRTAKSTDKVIFDLSNARVNGNTVDVPVSFESAEEVHAIDFNLNFDETKLSLNTVLDNIVDNQMSSVYHLNPNDRTLRYGAYTLNEFEAKQPIVSVRFDAENGEISSDDLSGVVGLLNGRVVDVTFVGSINKDVINNNVSIYPNPTSGLLNVLASENSTVQLMDVTGKEVLLQTTVNAYEKQEINVSNFANGVYMMKIFNNNSVTVKKVVLNK